jgi:hypothetical protein
MPALPSTPNALVAGRDPKSENEEWPGFAITIAAPHVAKNGEMSGHACAMMIARTAAPGT